MNLTLSHLIRVVDYTLNKHCLHILEMTDAISLNYSRIKKEKFFKKHHLLYRARTIIKI